MLQIDTMSPRNLKASVGDIRALISCSDKVASSAPGSGSRAAVGEDLAATTKVRLEARALTSQENTRVKKRRRFVESVALNVISSQGMVTNTCSRSYNTLDARLSTLTHVKSPQYKVHKCEVSLGLSLNVGKPQWGFGDKKHEILLFITSCSVISTYPYSSREILD